MTKTLNAMDDQTTPTITPRSTLLPALPAEATPENCPLKPSPGHLVVVRETPPHMRARVIIPQSAQDAGRGMMAEVWVMAVGDHAYFNHGGEWESPVQVGDRALTRGVNAFSTHKAVGSDIVWEVLPFDAIVALVNEDSVPTIPETRSIGGAI